MLFESGIYTMIMLIALLGVTVFSGSTDGTYEKNCTKIFKTQNEAEYYKYRTCSGFWFWKSCKYVQRTKTVRRPAYMYLPVCCPYFIEVNNTCIKGCEPGKYGENCTYNCTCPTNSIESCEKDTGNCTCVPGKQGGDCNKDCDVGHYGHDCLLTCSCMNNSTCDHVDGFCNCTAGYIGHNCEKNCNEGWYGLNCTYPCNCTSSQTCNPISGDCTCKPGRQGQDCEQECSNFTFGSNCAYVCDCVKETTENCNNTDGTCFCKPGWEGTHCRSTCSSGRFGENCKSFCNCSSDQFCEPASGMCLSDCFCKQPGTSNCDDKRNPCNCSDEMKDGACNASTRTTVEPIRRFMTTICNCTMEDAFCVPKNRTCYCKDGWTGDQCERELKLNLGKQDVSKKGSSDSAAIIGGAVAAIGIGLSLTIVLGLIFTKRKQSYKSSETTKNNESPNQFTNAAYSTEFQNLYQNENIPNTSTETEYSIARRLSSTEEDTSGFVETADYHHIKFNKDDKEVTSVYSHLAGNTSSNGNDGSTYDVSSPGRSNLADNTDNAYGVLRTTSDIDDTYDATKTTSRTFGIEDNVYNC